MEHIPTIYLCTAVSIISSVFYCRQHSLLADGPTNGSWSKLLSGGELEYLYWQYLVRLLLRVMVLRVLRVLGVVPKYFQQAQYSGNMRCIPTIYLRTAVSIFHPHFIAENTFTVDGWSHEWELKQNTFSGGTRILRVLAVFWEYMLRAPEIPTGSTLLILWVLQAFRISYCGCCLLYWGFCTTHHTPSTRSIWAFSARTAHTPSIPRS